MLGLIHNTQYKYRKVECVLCVRVDSQYSVQVQKGCSGCCVLGLIHNTQYKYRKVECVLCVRVDSQYSVQVQKG